MTGSVETENLSLKVYSSTVDLAGQADYLFCFSDAGNVTLDEFFINDALVEMRDESAGTCVFRDAGNFGGSSETVVKLYDESVLALSTEGSVSDYVYDDSVLN